MASDSQSKGSADSMAQILLDHLILNLAAADMVHLVLDVGKISNHNSQV